MRRLAIAVSLLLMSTAYGAQAKMPPTHDSRHECAPIPRYYGALDERAVREAERAMGSDRFRTFDRAPHFGRNFAPLFKAREVAEEFAYYGYDYVGAYEGYYLFERRAYGYFAFGPLARRLGGIDYDNITPSPQRIVTQPPFIGGVPIPPDLVAFPCR